jgi:hypothetical protein
MNVHAATMALLHLVRLEMLTLLWGLAAVVFYQIITGRIALDGLLSDGRNPLSPPRIQMMVINLVVLATYLSDPVQITTDSSRSALSIPAVGALMGGSSLVHLVHKFRISAKS